MLYIPKIDDDIKILTHEKMKDFVVINFSEYFKSIRKEQNLRKVAKSLYIFLTTPDEVEKYVQLNSTDNCVHHYNVKILNLFDPELQLINTKPVTLAFLVTKIRKNIQYMYQKMLLRKTY